MLNFEIVLLYRTFTLKEKIVGSARLAVFCPKKVEIAIYPKGDLFPQPSTQALM